MAELLGHTATGSMGDKDFLSEGSNELVPFLR
jgi:hypothetical protein